MDEREHQPCDPTAAGRTRPFTVCVVPPPSLPATRDERRHTIGQAVEHARRRPERQVLVILRACPGVPTPPIERCRYPELLRVDEAPPNLDLVYGSTAEILDRTDLCVTADPTAALEAMHRGIPTAVPADFGGRESPSGDAAHSGADSGALTSWRALHDGGIPRTVPAWPADHGVGGEQPTALHCAGPGPGGGPLSARPPEPTVQVLSTARLLRSAAGRTYRTRVRSLPPRLRRRAHS